ncbi:hypothetical protein C8R44DRAFT_742064 [Mycena epipterygia]|nr:hypothetical protein C8R44DRAFT_742064 [Mycena epipterygia]
MSRLRYHGALKKRHTEENLKHPTLRLPALRFPTPFSFRRQISTPFGKSASSQSVKEEYEVLTAARNTAVPLSCLVDIFDLQQQQQQQQQSCTPNPPPSHAAPSSASTARGWYTHPRTASRALRPCWEMEAAAREVMAVDLENATVAVAAGGALSSISVGAMVDRNFFAKRFGEKPGRRKRMDADSGSSPKPKKRKDTVHTDREESSCGIFTEGR